MSSSILSGSFVIFQTNDRKLFSPCRICCLFCPPCTGDAVRGDNSPTAISSKLGWLLSGPSTQNSTYESTTSNFILAGECIDNSHVQTDSNGDLTFALSRFWEPKVSELSLLRKQVAWTEAVS